MGTQEIDSKYAFKRISDFDNLLINSNGT